MIEEALRYPLEKFSDAVQALAIGKGDVRSRLLDAFPCFMMIRGDQLPEELQPKLDFVIKTMNKYSADYKVPSIKALDIGPLQYSLGRIQNRTGQKIAEEIYSIYQGLLFRDLA